MRRVAYMCTCRLPQHSRSYDLLLRMVGFRRGLLTLRTSPRSRWFHQWPGGHEKGPRRVLVLSVRDVLPRLDSNQ